MRIEKLIKKFLCPGCVCGGDVDCGKCDISDDYGYMCNGHILGSSIGLGVKFALGLPKGFNRSGPKEDRWTSMNKMQIRLFLNDGFQPSWDNLNVPVWAMEHDNFLFVRTYCPRIDDSFVDIIEGGKIALTPKAIDVSTFFDDVNIL